MDDAAPPRGVDRGAVPFERLLEPALSVVGSGGGVEGGERRR